MFTFGEAINQVMSNERAFTEQRLQQARNLRMQAVNLKLRDRLNAAMESMYKAQASEAGLRAEGLSEDLEAQKDIVTDGRYAGMSVRDARNAAELDAAEAGINQSEVSTEGQQITNDINETTRDAYNSTYSVDGRSNNLRTEEIIAGIENVRGQTSYYNNSMGGRGGASRSPDAFNRALINASQQAEDAAKSFRPDPDLGGINTNIQRLISIGNPASDSGYNPEAYQAGLNELNGQIDRFNGAQLKQAYIEYELNGKDFNLVRDFTIAEPKFDQRGVLQNVVERPITRAEFIRYLQGDEATVDAGGVSVTPPLNDNTPMYDYSDIVGGN